jgi:hypothetical protein
MAVMGSKRLRNTNSIHDKSFIMLTFQEPAPTFEDVWRMFQATDKQFQETDKKFQATDKQFQETDKKFQATDKQFQETDKKIQETDRIIKNLSKQLGELGNRLGEFVEQMVAPAVVRLFQEQGLEVHECSSNVTSKRNGEALEIDLLVINDGVLVAVECKSQLTSAHVDKHLERMEKLKRLLPLYKNHRALGALATMVASDEDKAYAQEKGFYVLCQNGEGIDICNGAAFTPKAW